MKNSIFIIIALFFVASIFTQCKKDDAITQKQDKVSKLTQKDIDFANRVNAFKDKLGKNYQTREVYTLDSALYYINATINYTYSGYVNNGQVPTKFYEDSAFVQINGNQQTLSFAEVESLYNDVLAQVSDMYYKVTDNDKRLGNVVVKYEPSSTRNGSQLNVRATTYSTWGLPSWLAFPESASFYWDMENDYNQPVYPSACSELTERYHRLILGNPDITLIGYRIIWEGNYYNNVYEPLNFTPYASGPYTNYNYYRLFYNDQKYPGYHEYLCGDELNFYLARIIELVNVIIPEREGLPVDPNSYWCFRINLDGQRVSMQEGSKKIKHLLNVEYANKILVPDDNQPIEPPVNPN